MVFQQSKLTLMLNISCYLSGVHWLLYCEKQELPICIPGISHLCMEKCLILSSSSRIVNFFQFLFFQFQAHHFRVPDSIEGCCFTVLFSCSSVFRHSLAFFVCSCYWSFSSFLGFLSFLAYCTADFIDHWTSLQLLRIFYLSGFEMFLVFSLLWLVPHLFNWLCVCRYSFLLSSSFLVSVFSFLWPVCRHCLMLTSNMNLKSFLVF